MILKVHVCSIVLHLSNVISHPLLNLMFINVIHTHRIILCVKTNSIFLYVHLVPSVTLKKKKCHEGNIYPRSKSSRAHIYPQVIWLPSVVLFLLCSSCLFFRFSWDHSHPHPSWLGFNCLFGDFCFFKI